MQRDIISEQQLDDALRAHGGHNKADRLDWFRRQGVGAFIHMSVDVQLGMVISHNLINANAAYCQRYFDELPRTFSPDRFDPVAWARFLKVIGMRYVVLTNKHHNGFCMWHTKTTDWNIKQTPYGRDMSRELLTACRAEGLAVGIYFSPDDFHVLWQQEKKIARRHLPGLLPKDNPQLMALAKAQLTELLTEYGDIDTIFFDGDATGLRELAWQLQPNCVVTRGSLATPEQRLPDVGEHQHPETMEPWEACFTLGRQWQYRALHEAYKSPRTLIEMLIRTRAGGGNLLLNFGPKADGSLAPEQEAAMREVGMWLFINRDAIVDVGPHSVAREGDVFFTKSADKPIVYAHLTNIDWPSLPTLVQHQNGDSPKRAENIDQDGLHSARTRTLMWRIKHLQAGPDTKISLLGQAVACVMPKALDESVEWRQEGDTLIVTAWYTQRHYNDYFWDLPMVLAIENPVLDQVHGS